MEKSIVITADKDLKKKLTDFLNKEFQGEGRKITLILDDMIVSKHESGNLGSLLSQALSSNSNDVVVITQALHAGAFRDYLGLHSILRPAVADKLHVEDFSTTLTIKDFTNGKKDKDFMADFKVPGNAYYIASQKKLETLEKSRINKLYYTKYTNIKSLRFSGRISQSVPYEPDNLPVIGVSINCLGTIGVDKTFAVINTDITNKKQLLTFLKNLK